MGRLFHNIKRLPWKGGAFVCCGGALRTGCAVHPPPPGFRLGEQGVQVVFAVDGDAVGFEEGGGHAVAGGEAAGERAVVDLAAAAARAALFQDGRFAAVEPGQMQRLLRPAAKLRGHVRAGS